MARIAGVNIPENKRVEIALQSIYGIGPAKANQIVKALKFKDSLRTKDLTDAEIVDISNYIEENFKVEGDVRRDISMNIKRLQDLKSYRVFVIAMFTGSWSFYSDKCQNSQG